MKKYIALFFAILLFSGCSAQGGFSFDGGNNGHHDHKNGQGGNK